MLLLVAILMFSMSCGSAEFGGDDTAADTFRRGSDLEVQDASPSSSTLDQESISLPRTAGAPPEDPPVEDPPAAPTPPIDDEPAPIVPQVCDATTISYAIGYNDCPANSAAYAIDDASTASIACCPLPADDILVGFPRTRLGSCFPGEVVTGTGGSGAMLRCTAINTERYSLEPETPTCYYGSGASGGGGAASCGAPNATIVEMTTRFGSDACLPSPWGGLITKRNGKDCDTMAASRLLFVEDGMPVPMFTE